MKVAELEEDLKLLAIKPIGLRKDLVAHLIQARDNGAQFFEQSQSWESGIIHVANSWLPSRCQMGNSRAKYSC